MQPALEKWLQSIISARAPLDVAGAHLYRAPNSLKEVVRLTAEAPMLALDHTGVRDEEIRLDYVILV